MSNRLIIKRGVNMDQPKARKPRCTYTNEFRRKFNLSF